METAYALLALYEGNPPVTGGFPSQSASAVGFANGLANRRDPGDLRPVPCLNIKTVLSTYGDSHVKDKTAVRTSYL